MITAAETVFVSAEEKLTIAGSLESAYRAMNSAWSLWTARAHRDAWDGQYWDEGDIADLERLVLIACTAVESTEQALGALSVTDDEPRVDDGLEEVDDSIDGRLPLNGERPRSGSADGDERSGRVVAELLLPDGP
jgi:hypothetical protein